MVNCLFEKYDTGGSTARFRLIQAIFDLLGIIISFGSFGFVYLLVDPKIRYFTCDTASDISFPRLPDTVPLYVLGLFGTIGPILIIILVEIYNAKFLSCNYDERSLRQKTRSFFIVIFHSLSLFVFGMGVQLLLTEIGKRWAGRLRPHFLSVCNHSFNSSECYDNIGLPIPIYTGNDFCPGDAKLIKEARLSFPSGHASFSTYTMLFLVIYLEARLQTLKFRAVKPLIQVTAISAAWVTCLSRIVDYYHRGSDVIGGAILGGVIAIAFGYYFGKVLWEYDIKKKKTDFDLMNDEE